MGIEFAKLQGAGNGYIALDGRDVERNWSALAVAMGRRHFGVGSDGLVVVRRSEVAPVRMRVFNTDGSEAEMSGNGLRLFARFVLDRGIASAGAEGLRVETGGGVRTVWPTLRDGRMVAGRIAMGEPRTEAAAIPVRGDFVRAGGPGTRVVLDLEGRHLDLTCLSLGNPHAVLLVDEPVEEFPLAEVGPLVQGHPAFPERVNFEVVRVEARDRVRARIFERGEGETLSSGTGSTASVVAARLHGRTDDRVEVCLRGGRLHVEWPGAGEAWLAGPVEEVFRGVWPG